MLTAAIVTSRVERISHLEACLLQTGLVASVRWGAPSPEQYPSPGESVPDIVIIDLSDDPESGLGLTAHLRELRPNVFIVAWSSSQQPAPELLLQAMRGGVQDFLFEPINPATFKETLTRLARQLEIAEARGSQLTMVIGAKGGAGTTTVTVNIGVQLIRLTKKRVTLLDFARPLGLVSLLLDIQPRFSVHDSVENLERLDKTLFTGLVTRHKSGLGVLAGTSSPDEWLDMPLPALARVVNVAQSSCDFLLIDLGSAYSPGWSTVLKQAHTVILVAEADVTNLRNLERHVSAMASFGVDPERLRIVINRWHPRDEERLEGFQEKTKCSILARLPNDFKQVSRAITAGVPLSENQSDPLGTEYRKVASELAGIANITSTPEAGVLVSFLDVLRQKSADHHEGGKTQHLAGNPSW